MAFPSTNYLNLVAVVYERPVVGQGDLMAVYWPGLLNEGVRRVILKALAEGVQTLLKDLHQESLYYLKEGILLFPEIGRIVRRLHLGK